MIVAIQIAERLGEAVWLRFKNYPVMVALVNLGLSHCHHEFKRHVGLISKTDRGVKPSAESPAINAK